MIEVKEDIKNPLIIEGFPGFGFASTIATEFLIKHLDAVKVGRIFSKKIAPLVAIHDNEIIDPLEIYYDKKNNLVILRALTNVSGAEWEIADMIIELSKKLKAKEIISLEGIASGKIGKNKVFYFTNLKNGKLKDINLSNLQNGVIIGVTGILLLKSKDIPLSCIFVEANPSIPDSRAAGEIIKVLDSYLGLNVDYKPLIKSAEEVEGKLKDLMTRFTKTSQQSGQKIADYLG